MRKRWPPSLSKSARSGSACLRISHTEVTRKVSRPVVVRTTTKVVEKTPAVSSEEDQLIAGAVQNGRVGLRPTWPWRSQPPPDAS
jgi:hypothetical protein